MSEHPILFSGEMVRAILDGRKTQTRRVIKPQPEGADYWTEYEGSFYPNTVAATWPILRCPYGVAGDRLWVRETWAPISPDETWRPIKECNIEYKADTPNARYPGDWPADCGDDPDCSRWRPSIHMPRWASRITLEVTGVKVERVNDINEWDVLEEGINVPADGKHSNRQQFSELWDSINGKRGFGWDTSPWVWAITFRQVTP